MGQYQRGGVPQIATGREEMRNQPRLITSAGAYSATFLRFPRRRGSLRESCRWRLRSGGCGSALFR